VKKFLPLVGIIAVAMTGCGGGASSNTSATPTVTGAPTTGYPVTQPPGTTSSPANGTSADFKIVIPNATASKTAGKVRHPQYISSGTQSVVISLTSVNGLAYSAIAPVTANLTPGSGNCVAGTGDTSLICTVSFVSVPMGTDGFTATLYDGLMGAGDALSTNKTTADVLAGTVINVPLTLQGIIKTLAVNVGAPSLAPGTVSSHPVTVTGYDASGAQIIGSAPYNNGPIVMTTDDTNSAISGLTNLPNAGGTESFNYDGMLIPTNTTHVIASVGSITAEDVIPVTVSTETANVVGLPIDAAFTGSASPYAISGGIDTNMVVQIAQANWGTVAGHSFTTTNNCGSNMVVTAGPSVDQFTIAAANTNAIACAVTVHGGGAQSDVLNFSLTNSKNGINAQLQSTNRK